MWMVTCYFYDMAYMCVICTVLAAHMFYSLRILSLYCAVMHPYLFLAQDISL
jgi:hypothetical protein